MSSLEGVCGAVRADNPSLFYVGNMKIKINHTLNFSEIYPQYSYAKREAKNISVQCNAVADGILSGIKNKDDWSRELFVHDFLCDSVTYLEYGAEAHSIAGILLHKSGVCEGIAKTAKFFFDKLMIESCYVTGKSKSPKPDGQAEGQTPQGKSENHSWNKVKIDGAWYNLDITFDNTLKDGKSARYDYFNLSDADISGDHRETGASGIHCTDGSNGYYQRNNLIMRTQRQFIDYLKGLIQNNIFELTVKLPGAQSPETVYEKVMENARKALDELKVYKNIHLCYNKEQLVFAIELR
jgi:hypothetical protein